MNLAGYTTLVTGAGAGVGREIAMALAAKGAHVIVATRTQSGQAVVHDATSNSSSQPHRLDDVDDALWAEHFSVSIDAEPTMEARLARRIPLGRIGDPEADVGAAVAFLVGPDARYVTGHPLGVDGGHYTTP